MPKLIAVARKLGLIDRHLVTDEGGAPCCCDGVVCFMRYDVCDVTECQQGSGTIYVPCDECLTVFYMGACYTRVDDTRYAECNGGDPPPGFTCLPPDSITIDVVDCVDDCYDQRCLNVYFLADPCAGIEPGDQVPVIPCGELPNECVVFAWQGTCWFVSPSSSPTDTLPPNGVVVVLDDLPKSDNCCECNAGNCDETGAGDCWADEGCGVDKPPVEDCCCDLEAVIHISQYYRRIKRIFNGGGEDVETYIGQAYGVGGVLSYYGQYTQTDGTVVEESGSWFHGLCGPVSYRPFGVSCSPPCNLTPGALICSATCDINSISGVCLHDPVSPWIVETTITVVNTVIKPNGTCGADCTNRRPVPGLPQNPPPPAGEPPLPSVDELLGLG